MYTLIIYKESDYENYCGTGYYRSEFTHLRELSYDDLFERLILICYNDLHRENGEGETAEIIIYEDGKLIEELYGNFESAIIKSAKNFAELLDFSNQKYDAQLKEKKNILVRKDKEMKELEEYERLKRKFDPKWKN